ncbi:hypothetical protein FB45DRAFT_301236 [Roridomyces roridus]|uniref:Uncharacterized protein n=1 Tax=Roridomyces roridus TaxID=1738132 RepID=A0AAD7FXZ0_9AGAR|nr:hypothetical protein FB45DRAFT_301236 [Roridomyces roridus]
MMSSSLSTSTGTIRSIHARPSSPSPPPPPSPPESPALSASGSSVSSLPSVSSSFFFSSAAASPPHPASGSHAHSIAGEELIIPSLTLPPPLRLNSKPAAAAGKQRAAPITRLIVLGPRDPGVSAILSATGRHAEEYGIEDDEDDGQSVLRIQGHRDKDQHEAEMELIVVEDNLQPDVVYSIERRILQPFRRLADVLAPPMLSGESDAERELIESLLASGTTPLYTALVVVGPEAVIPESLRALIPVVTLPLPPPPPPSDCTDDDADDDADQADLDHPLTVPLRPRHANREMTEIGRGFSVSVTEDAPSSYPDAEPGPTLDISTLRLSAARLFVRWWRAGAKGAYAPDESSFPALFSFSEKTPMPPHQPVYLAPPASAYSCSYAHLNTDPLHLPSLFLLFRGVVSATARQVREARAWWGVGVGVGAFLVGVLVGVQVGTGRV